MHALNENVGTSSAYRVLLQTFLQIPAQAADLAIRHKVKARFPAELLKELVDAGSFSREACEIIISLRALDARVHRWCISDRGHAITAYRRLCALTRR